MIEVKKVLVTGANGYVGNFILKTMAKQYPTIQMLGMSRRGKLREGEARMPQNVSFVSGDLLKPNTFEHHLLDTDAVIHCVGSLFESRNPERSLQALNRDSCINVATLHQKYALENNQQRTFVMVSASRAPFFAPRYLSAKQEAEKFL